MGQERSSGMIYLNQFNHYTQYTIIEELEMKNVFAQLLILICMIVFACSSQRKLVGDIQKLLVYASIDTCTQNSGNLQAQFRKLDSLNIQIIQVPGSIAAQLNLCVTNSKAHYLYPQKFPRGLMYGYIVVNGIENKCVLSDSDLIILGHNKQYAFDTLNYRNIYLEIEKLVAN